MTPQSFVAIINQLLPEPHAGLLSGIIFGTKATLSKELTDALITTGTLHIVALSGMNITILTSLVATVFLPLFSRRIASLITIVIIIGFILFVGPSPSVVRAGIMGSIALLSISRGRQYWPIYILLLAVAIMIALYPPWLTDLGFQLSVFATLGIILFGGKKKYKQTLVIDGAGKKEIDKESENRLLDQSQVKRIGHYIWSLTEDDLRITLAAQVFTVPLIFLHFHRISFVSPLTNILIGWTIAPITILGFVVSILGWIWLPLGQVVAWIAWIILEYIVGAIYLTSRLPLASVGF